MPSAVIQVLDTNDLIIVFNDTLYEMAIDSTDMNIQIFGPESSYSLSWTASYQDSSSVFVNMNIKSSLVGNNQEIVEIEFVNRDKFKSIFSQRGVNPTVISEYLNTYTGQSTSSKQFGLTAMIVFLSSITIALISSFGGNSMEMMWNLMNTLQLLYFLSFVFVNYPESTMEFFDYLSYANADNEYLSEVAYVFYDKDKFKRGEANDRLGDKAFLVNSSDKIEIMMLLLIAFIATICFDSIKIKKRGKLLRLVNTIFEFLKYNFFIRFGMEIFLEVMINAVINIYWVSIHIYMLYLCSCIV